MANITSNSITITVSDVPNSITLTASATSVTVGQTVTFSGTVLDPLGNGLSGVTVTLVDSTTGTTSTTKSGSGGAFSFNVTFNSAGTYTLYAEA